MESDHCSTRYNEPVDFRPDDVIIILGAATFEQGRDQATPAKGPATKEQTEQWRGICYT